MERAVRRQFLRIMAAERAVKTSVPAGRCGDMAAERAGGAGTGGEAGPDPGGTEPLHQDNPLLSLPIVAIDSVLGLMAYDEISGLRLVCKRMDAICQRLLNQGFLKVERYHSLCQKQVKAQLPRRESERRNHSLARHADILAAVETRLSLLNMTFMKYVDTNLCCFIPGKVIDEIYRVLRYVNSTRSPQRAHEVLQELRDISSMAMEYFDEKIVPILKKKLSSADMSGRLLGVAPVPGPSTALTAVQLFSKQNPARQELCKLQQQVKAQGLNVTSSRRELSEIRIKFQEQVKQLQDQDQKILEQNQVIGEQSARLAELDRKLAEHTLKHQQSEQKLKELQELLQQVIETGAGSAQVPSGHKRKKVLPGGTAKRLRSRKLYLVVNQQGLRVTAC
ncbi:sphingolipid delta(4)-desaturase DES1 isoform X2 [Narcine bancroftii]|uniref:sphingolipid delta(4)-desaturase DES1 isoform X2 n=2 Tax=Narcine bancroftii TaxID=1343680 RepID=UPI00383131FC